MRPVIDVRMMEAMRPIVEGTMPDRAEVVKRTITGTGMNKVETWSTLWTGPCRLDRGDTNSEIDAAGSVLTYSSWMVTLPAGVLVEAEHRIRVTQDGETRLFEITSVNEPQSYSAEMQIQVTKVD